MGDSLVAYHVRMEPMWPHVANVFCFFFKGVANDDIHSFMFKGFVADGFRIMCLIHFGMVSSD